jgi:hypothetical protein
MWKLTTTVDMLERLRSFLAMEAPEQIDLGLRIASAKATAIENHPPDEHDEHVPSYPVVVYLTEAEHRFIADAQMETKKLKLPNTTTWVHRDLRTKF